MKQKENGNVLGTALDRFFVFFFLFFFKQNFYRENQIDA